jgi:hypothetical protein
MMSTENDSNGDALPLESMSKVQIGANEDMNELEHRMESKGIHMNRTVEITREERVKDMV